MRTPYYSIFQETYSLPNGGQGTYYAIRGLHTAFVVPFVSPSEIILITQFRYLYQENAWEFPAGRVNSGEEPVKAAARELEEEAGYRAERLIYAGWFAPCNGLTDERTEVYLAANLTQVEQRLDATEQITAHRVSIHHFEHMINNNEVRDGMSLAAWQIAQSRYKELFT